MWIYFVGISFHCIRENKNGMMTDAHFFFNIFKSILNIFRLTAGENYGKKMIRKISCWWKLRMLFNFFVYFFQNKIWQKKNFQIKKFPQIFLLYILNIKIDCVYNFEFDSIEKFSFKSIQHNSFYFNKYQFQLIKQFLFEKVSKKREKSLT